jgi:hypothetical protein
MLFVAHETPGLGITIVTGAQHALLILMFMVYVVVVGREIGLSETALRGFISLQIVILGLGTVLQCLTTRLSSGHLVIHAPSIISASVFTAVAMTHGLAATAGALILSGIIVLLLARLLPKLRSIFPPEVSGVLLLLLGLSLVQGGIMRFTGFDGDSFSIASILAASAVLATIVIVSIWATANIRLFAMALGTLAGLIVAFITGQFGAEQLSLVAEAALDILPPRRLRIADPDACPIRGVFTDHHRGYIRGQQHRQRGRHRQDEQRQLAASGSLHDQSYGWMSWVQCNLAWHRRHDIDRRFFTEHWPGACHRSRRPPGRRCMRRHSRNLRVHAGRLYFYHADPPAHHGCGHHLYNGFYDGRRHAIDHVQNDKQPPHVHGRAQHYRRSRHHPDAGNDSRPSG